MNSLIDCLRRDTFDSYTSIRHNVNSSLVAIRKHLKDMFGRKAWSFQQGVYDPLCSAAGGVHKSFGDAPEVVDRSLSLILWLSKRHEPARSGSLSAHSANREPRQSRTRAMSDTPRSLAPVSFAATDPRDYPGRC